PSAGRGGPELTRGGVATEAASLLRREAFRAGEELRARRAARDRRPARRARPCGQGWLASCRRSRARASAGRHHAPAGSSGNGLALAGNEPGRLRLAPRGRVPVERAMRGCAIEPADELPVLGFDAAPVARL